MRGLLNAAKLKQTSTQQSNSQENNLYTLLQSSQQKDELKRQKIEQESQRKKEEKKRAKLNRMAVSQNMRREEWINTVLQDKEFLQAYQKGVVPMVHTSHHKFRDFNATSVTSRTNNNTAGSSRMMESIKLYQSQEFSDKQPHLINNFRDKHALKQLSGNQFKYQPFTQDMRVAEVIQNTPKLTTEPLNTLLISMPKFREYDQSKWSSKRDFNAQKTSKDKSWEPIQNTNSVFSEPFMERVLDFRSSYNGGNKDSLAEYFQSKYDFTSPKPQAEKIQSKMFDSTIPQDTTWKNRIMESQSLRQRAHLNQSLKLKDKSKESNFASYNYNTPLKISSLVDDIDRQSSAATPEKKVQRFFKLYNSVDKSSQLSKIISENSPSSNRNNHSKVKEKIIDLNKVNPDSAAQLLNSSQLKSFTNSWQYQIVKPLQNKNFKTREELNESHILGELDKVKTYYSSVMGKIPPRTSLNSPFNNDGRNQIIREEFNDSIDINIKKSAKRYNRTNMGSPECSDSKKRAGTKVENRLKYGSIKQAIDKYFEKRNSTTQGNQK